MDNNKINVTMSALIKEYVNNNEKVRVIIKTNNRHTPHTVVGESNNLNTRLIRRNELRRYNIRNYVYSLLILYI